MSAPISWDEENAEPFIPIEVVDLDTNDDGLLSAVETAAMVAAYPSVEGDPEYDRQLDVNFDDSIDKADVGWLAAYRTENPDLGAIRRALRNYTYEKLTFTRGSWSCYLCALSSTASLIEDFVGRDGGQKGWISIHLHPYNNSNYRCDLFARDTALAAYKALGYGCILHAEGSSGHEYNVFWNGSDYQNLTNWYIIEPQTGQVFNAGQSGLDRLYQTARIYFWKRISGSTIYTHILLADYAAKTVSIYDIGERPLAAGGVAYDGDTEEPYPNAPNDYSFDVSLGIEIATPKTSSDTLVLADVFLKAERAIVGSEVLEFEESATVTGFTAGWENQEQAYDGDLDTAATSLADYSGWGEFLELTIDEVLCSVIRIYAKHYSVGIGLIDFDIYRDGDWHHVYEDTYPDCAWVEADLSGTYRVTKARVRFYHEELKCELRGLELGQRGTLSLSLVTASEVLELGETLVGMGISVSEILKIADAIFYAPASLKVIISLLQLAQLVVKLRKEQETGYPDFGEGIIRW